MTERRTALFLLILFMLTLTGCKLSFLGMTEMNRNEFIRVVGIDKLDDRIKATIVTEDFAPKEGGSDQQEQFQVKSAEGRTVFEALRNFGKFTDKRPFWGRVEYLLIGEEAGKDGILKYIDLFCRDPEIRLNLEVFIVKGASAQEAIEKTNGESKFIYDNLKGITENQWGESIFQKVDLIEAMYILDCEYLSLYLPCIHLLPPNDINQEKSLDIAAEGFSIFDGDKLVLHAHQELGRGLNWLRNNIKSGVIIVKSPNGANISLEIIDNNTKIEAKIIDGDLNMIVKVDMSSNIDEIHSSENIFTGDIIEDLERQQGEVIKNEITQIIKYAQQHKTDFFGTADVVLRKFPILFEDQYRDNWNEVFSDIKFDVIVYSNIARTYDIKEPNRSKIGDGK